MNALFILQHFTDPHFKWALPCLTYYGSLVYDKNCCLWFTTISKLKVSLLFSDELKANFIFCYRMLQLSVLHCWPHLTMEVLHMKSFMLMSCLQNSFLLQNSCSDSAAVLWNLHAKFIFATELFSMCNTSMIWLCENQSCVPRKTKHSQSSELTWLIKVSQLSPCCTHWCKSDNCERSEQLNCSTRNFTLLR